jgi:sugar lactone lactonase YvrE
LEDRLCLTVDLLVADFSTFSVHRYDGTTGAYIDDFVPPGSGGLSHADGLVYGPDGNLYVSSREYNPGPGSVLRYDGTTGNFLGAFVPAGSGGLNHPGGLTFGPDGNLYVSSLDTNSVLRYDGTTGGFIDVFASGGGLDTPLGLVFGPDGNLYVSSGHSASVLYYDGTTGNFLGAFVPAGSGGLSNPAGLIFGPDGNLYVSSSDTNVVLRYDGTTGTFIDTFASDGGLVGPRGLTFGPDGNLYVSSVQPSSSVLRYDGSTGGFIDSFVPQGSGGLIHPTYMVFQDINPAGPRSAHLPMPGHADAVALLLATPPERFARAPGSGDFGPTLEAGHGPAEPTGPSALSRENNPSPGPQQPSPASAGELHPTMVDRIFEGLEDNLLPGEPWHTVGVL